jgi:hypothetical protein
MKLEEDVSRRRCEEEWGEARERLLYACFEIV